MNELSRHKKSDKAKWILTFIVLVVVSVVIVGVCMQLFAKDNLKPSNWLDTKKVESPKDSDGAKPTDEPKINTYVFAMTEHGEGSEAYQRELKFDEFWTFKENVLLVSVKTKDVESNVEMEKVVALNRFDVVLPDNHGNEHHIVGWSDSGTTECNICIMGIVFGANKYVIIMSMEECTITLETTMIIEDLGVWEAKTGIF